MKTNKNRTPPDRPRLRSLNRDEIRGIDDGAIQDIGIPGSLLMENAGRGIADVVAHLGIDGPIVVVAGRGNNGGDGFVAARQLDCRGYSVHVLLLADSSRLRGDAQLNWKIITNSGIRCQELGDAPNVNEFETLVSRAAWTLDGLLGTGTRGKIREPFATAIECLNGSAQRILAIDVPSGLDCDTGEALGPCVKAGHTVTFVASKKGFDTPGASTYTGHVHIVDIGVPRVLLDPYRIGDGTNKVLRTDVD